MRIKHAYNTLLNSQSRRKYDNRNDGSDYSYSCTQTSESRKTQDEEEFYGFGKILYPIEIKLIFYELIKLV